MDYGTKDSYTRTDGVNRYYSVKALHPDEPSGHNVMVPEEAIADRMALYGLSSEDEAVKHIMWEHHIRLNPGAPDSVLPADVKVNFDRVWGPGHKPARGIPMTAQEQQAQAVRWKATQDAYLNRRRRGQL